MTHQEKEVNFLLKATGNGYPSHQPSKSNEEVAQALMMKTAQQGGLHTRDIIKALQDKDAEREKAVEEEQNRILKECFELIEWNKDTKNQWAGIIHANTTINAIQQIVDRVREPLVSGTTPQNISNDK